MEETKKSTAKYWIYCTIWLALMVFMLATPSVRPFFWLALPGTATSFAKAMDLI
jgi:hypothetical protein